MRAERLPLLPAGRAARRGGGYVHEPRRISRRHSRRKILLGGTTLAAASAIGAGAPVQVAQAQAQPAQSGQRPRRPVKSELGKHAMRDAFVSITLKRARAFAAALGLLAGLCGSVDKARADQGGVGFWLPGAFGSLAATPLVPGWSLGAIYLHSSVSAGGDVAASRSIGFPTGRST